MNPVDIKYLLKDITASKYKPKGKEVGLLKSMEERVRDGRYATDPQSKWLQRIYRQSQNGGGYQNRKYV